MSKKQKKVRTAGKTNLNKDFRDQWRVTTNSNSLILKIMAPVPSKRASVSIYKAQCMVLPVSSPVVSTCCVLDKNFNGLNFPQSTNMTNKYVHHFLVQDRVCCKFASVS